MPTPPRSRLPRRSSLLTACALALCAACAVPPPVKAAGGGGGGGERQFEKYCSACHTMEPGRNRTGPSLYGVAGRRAAGGPSSYMYSEALRASGLTWDDRSLDAFLAHPTQTVPGTHMIFPGVADADSRAAIVDYLKNP